jgi:hypothetical protein
MGVDGNVNGYASVSNHVPSNLAKRMNEFVIFVLVITIKYPSMGFYGSFRMSIQEKEGHGNHREHLCGCFVSITKGIFSC